MAVTTDGTALAASQTVVARFEYDSYGRQISASGVESGNVLYCFQSKRLGERSQLYGCGYRFYTPRFGRFISIDLIRESGGINLHGYVGNSPANGRGWKGTRLVGPRLTWIVRSTGRPPGCLARQ